ncbi:helix-turn-helix domain-containing protein [Microvirga sp. 2TAF3]|uniref:helix-turn-helix domain-containing protein n=1 Tax=Microvirga sp. 2TAF3 TaxID=3233014 RepID=UPI003F9B4941
MVEADQGSSNLTANLKLLCSYHTSTSEVCRRLQINRQQFMKYLAGTAFPSRHNLRRICDFFGVDEYEILMPHEQFREIVRLRPHGQEDSLVIPPMFRNLLGQAQRQKGQLTKYLGYYYKYFYSFSSPGSILRSLVCVYTRGDYTLYKTVERLKPPGAQTTPYIFKYSGLLVHVGDRLHMIDYEAVAGHEISQTILYPSYRNRVITLIGLMIGVSGTEAHQPTAARVALEYVGRTINLRRALEGCRLYSENSTEISYQVTEYLKGSSSPPVHLLRAETA